MIATRAGPRGATRVQRLPGRGSPPTVALVVEVWGAGDRREALEARLASGLWRSIESGHGSLTARVRDAITAGHHWLTTLEASGDTPLGGGVSVAVLSGDEALLAQCGPAVAFTPGSPEPLRHPAASPWLKRGVRQLAWDRTWPPLGLGAEPVIHWHTISLATDRQLLLATTAAAEHLSHEVVTRLFTTAESGLAAALDSVLEPEAAALLLTLPRPPTAPAASKSRPPATAGPTPAAPSTEAALPVRGRVLPVLLPALRVATARAARSGARVLGGLLPTRPAADSGRYAAERARLSAAAAIGLPLAVFALAIAYGLQSGRLGREASPAAPNTAPLAGPTAQVQDDPSLRITRLDGAAPVIALPGGATDDRQVVALGGVPYILNRDQDRADRVEGGVITSVLARGQVVGDTVVGALEDLVWMPDGAGARLLALDAAGSLWRIDGGPVTSIPRAEQPVWRSVTRLAGFGGNLYALDRAVGQIHRYAAQPGGYTSPGAAWLVENLALANVMDMAIDGDIFLLASDGTVRKFSAGVPAPFRLADTPEGLARGHTLQALGDGLGLLITDPTAGRVLRFRPDGAFETQLLLPAQAAAADPAARAGRIPGLQDGWWDTAGGVLYLVAAGWLYQAPYAPSR